MKILYTDASFDYHHADETTEPFVRGKIAVYGMGIKRVDKVAIGKVEGLRQYINILELTAIARAVELMAEMKAERCDRPEICNHFGCHPEPIQIITDSRVAMWWARNGKIKNKVRTVAHEGALEYLAKAIRLFGGEVTFNQVPREQNPAGKVLELELQREAPHAV